MGVVVNTLLYVCDKIRQTNFKNEFYVASSRKTSCKKILLICTECGCLIINLEFVHNFILYLT